MLIFRYTALTTASRYTFQKKNKIPFVKVFEYSYFANNFAKKIIVDESKLDNV